MTMTDKDRRTLLHHTAVCGQVSVLKELLAKGQLASLLNQWDSHSMTPLHLASERGNNDAVEVLLKAGANAKLKADVGLGATPMHLAARNGQHEAVRLLLRAGADPADKDAMDKSKTALHLVVQENHEQGVKILLDANPRLMKQMDVNRITPLDIAKS